MEDKKWYDRSSVQVGNGIIVSPDSIYDVVIEYQQKAKNTPGSNKKTWNKDAQFSRNTITLEGSDLEERVFKPGHIYNINIAIYGNKEIEVYSSLSQWKDGGEIPVDAEEDKNE